METITCTPEELAAAFTEWERRFREEPERFLSESERLPQETPESYGEACAPYFRQLIEEARRNRQTRERALASGWTAEAGPAVTAVPAGEERSLPEPVRGVGGDPRRGDEYLARRIEGQLDLPRHRGSFPGRKK